MKRRPTEHPVDLSNIGERWAARSNPDVVGIPHGHGELPYDLPVIMEVARVWGDFPGKPDHGVGPARGLLGWAMALDCFVIGAQVKVKLFRDPHGIAVEVDGEEVYKRVLKREDMLTATAARDRRREVESKFVDAMDLQPGDEVIEEDGVVKVNRAERAKHDRRAKRVNKRTTAAKRAEVEEEEISWED